MAGGDKVKINQYFGGLGLNRSRQGLLGVVAVTAALLAFSLMLVQPPSSSGSPAWLENSESPLNSLGRFSKVDTERTASSEGPISQFNSPVITDENRSTLVSLMR